MSTPITVKLNTQKRSKLYQRKHFRQLMSILPVGFIITGKP